MTQLNDAELDATAMVRQLYVEHAVGIARALGRLVTPGTLVDDLLHDVFLVALRRPEAMLTAQSPRAWLYGIALKIAVGARRRQRVRRFLGLDDTDSAALGVTHDPSRNLEQREAEVKVARALERVGERKREVLVLFELEGLSGAEVAAAIGIPVDTVWTRLHHARAELRQKLLQLDAIDAIAPKGKGLINE